MAKRHLVIITGMSGAGKSLASNTFEDLDFLCIDNMPTPLLYSIENLWGPPKKSENVAITVDVRAGQFFNELKPSLDEIRNNGLQQFDKPTILFLDASDAELVRRFKETRRKHPLVTEKRGIIDAIGLERTMLADLKVQADKIIDTTSLEPEELRRHIRDIFGPKRRQERMMVSVISFGFKHGIPLDADLVFDVRFLINPYWKEELKDLDGTHEPVEHYIMSDPNAKKFEKKLRDLVEFTLPCYIREGKAYLTIAIGCTGGKHRSVVVSEHLADALKKENYMVRLEHRDLKHARKQRNAV